MPISYLGDYRISQVESGPHAGEWRGLCIRCGLKIRTGPTPPGTTSSGPGWVAAGRIAEDIIRDALGRHRCEPNADPWLLGKD